MSTLRSSLTESSVIMKDDMYCMSQLPFGANDIQQRYEDIIGPLTLFAPYAHEDVDLAFLNEGAIRPERPVTPIDDEITSPPRTFNLLSKFVRRRIAPSKDVKYMSIEDQQALARVIMGELNGMWPTIKRQVDDPFLSSDENKEIRRKVAVHVVTVCETLISHYVKKVQLLNKRGVFTGAANMSRLKAQLSLDSNKFLNIQLIRRFLSEALHDKPSQVGDNEMADVASVLSSHSIPTMSYDTLLLSSRHRPKTHGKRTKTIEDEIKEINRRIPDHLQTDKLWPIMNELLERNQEKAETIESSKTSSFRADSDLHISDGQLSLQKLTLKKSSSLPEIQVGENLMDELEMEPPSPRPPSAHNITLPDENIKKKLEEDKKKPPTEVDKTADLLNLLKDSNKRDSHVEDDMPPLLQAITLSVKHDGRKEKLQQKLKKLQQKEEEEQAKLNVPLRPPIHPQPATVPLKPDKKNLVRISDVRVSERVCISSLTVEKYSTVYNDLLGEIDAMTVKKMDKNLFKGEEIREVYSEIMKTVPTDHLTLEHDELISPTAESVNLHAIMMPSALPSRSLEKVVNADLQKSLAPPWGDGTILGWAKMPGSSGNQDDAAFNPLEANRELTNIKHPELPSKILSVDEYKEKLADAPRMVQERLSRNYASWLTWWKNNIDSDDYMKYLAGQETDYLGYIFHFYDSEDDDDDGRSGPSRRSKKSASTHSLAGGLSRKSQQTKAKTSTINSKQHSPSLPSSHPESNKPNSPPQFESFEEMFGIETQTEGQSKTKGSKIPKLISKADVDACFRKVMGKKFRKMYRSNQFYDSFDSPRVVKLGKDGLLVIDVEDMNKEQQEKLDELKSEKRKYTPGMWNINSVFMGGLGKEPQLQESDQEICKTPLTVDTHKTKSGVAIIKKVSSTKNLSEEVLGLKQSEGERPNTRTSKFSKSTGVSKTFSNSMVGMSQDAELETSQEKAELSPQERLEKVWFMLQMPDRMKLDMAIKYSSDVNIAKLDSAIDAWEKATTMIIQREKLLARLENFERVASDPTRFFERGYRGSSVARLEEARQRSAFYQRLEEIEDGVRISVTYVQREFQDSITFQGRPYSDKMHWDKTEMLHWLSEERKQNILERHVLLNNIPTNVNHLEPIISTIQT